MKTLVILAIAFGITIVVITSAMIFTSNAQAPISWMLWIGWLGLAIIVFGIGMLMRNTSKERQTLAQNQRDEMYRSRQLFFATAKKRRQALDDK